MREHGTGRMSLRSSFPRAAQIEQYLQPRGKAEPSNSREQPGPNFEARYEGTTVDSCSLALSQPWGLGSGPGGNS